MYVVSQPLYDTLRLTRPEAWRAWEDRAANGGVYVAVKARRVRLVVY